MKTLNQIAGHRIQRKYNVQESPGRMWANMGKEGNRFKRSDGSIGSDKTVGVHSRPQSKIALRQANRSIQKSARQRLKLQIADLARDS